MKKLIAVLVLFTAYISIAGDGTTDTTFGTNGITLFLGDVSGAGTPLFVSADQKIYVTGGLNQVLRLTPDGVLDITFNPSGTPGILQLASDIFLSALLEQPDGNLLLGGSMGSNQTEGVPWIMRYTDEGLADPTFNGGQPQIFSSFTGFVCNSFALQSDLSIVASIAAVTGAPLITLARLTANGILDASFNSSGIVQTPIASDVVQGTVALTQDQKIVVALYGSSGFPNSIIVAQYTQDGALDITFNPTGSPQGIIIFPAIAEIVFGALADLSSVVIQPDGKILIGYSAFNAQTAQHSGLQIARLTPQGALDTTFNGSGFSQYAQLVPNTFALLGNLLLQPDGNILLVGNLFSPAFGNNGIGLVAVRYTSTGVIDTSFGTNGYAINPALESLPGGCGGALQADGKILGATVGGGLLVTRFNNNHPLTLTSVTVTSPGLSGNAQSLGVVYINQNGDFLCSSEVIDNTWSCAASFGPGTYTFTVINQYPGGNINLGTSCTVTLPQSALSVAIKNKYCPC